ncbi:MAG: SagB/ThcOx family dehydrogenase [Planctomycetota bacterium]
MSPLRRNFETDRLFAYHERTKHNYASVYGGGWALDWSNQPNPFRRYEGAPRFALPEASSRTAPAGAAPAGAAQAGTAPACTASVGACLAGLASAEAQPWPSAGLPLLGALLRNSMAVSAWKQVLGTDVRYSLRVNPSSGNLHPTEIWLALAGLSDVPDGLYHYDVRHHALEQRRSGPAAAAIAQQAGLPHEGRGALLVLSSIFWRESWKYRERAYRYCLLDAGHAAGSLALAARALGLSARLHGHFPDAALTELLAVDPDEEHPLMLLDLRDEHRGAAARPLQATAANLELGWPQGRPNVLSEEVRLWPLIAGMHASTLVEDEPVPPPLPEPVLAETPPVDLPAGSPADMPLGLAVHRRRSAIDYLPEGRASAADFAGILREAACLPRADFLGNLAGGPPTRLVDLYAYVHRVDDAPVGCWLSLPQRSAARLVRAGDVRSAAAGLSLGQELAGHAVAAFSMIADLERGARAFGNRAYRYAHFEAGLIGQALYLSATARGLQATGIGAFFDDDVHRWLSLSGRSRQVIYHHSIGLGAPDARLVDSDLPEEQRDAG